MQYNETHLHVWPRKISRYNITCSSNNKIIIVLHYNYSSNVGHFQRQINNLHLFSKERCTRPTIPVLSDISPAVTAIIAIQFLSDSNEVS